MRLYGRLRVKSAALVAAVAVKQLPEGGATMYDGFEVLDIGGLDGPDLFPDGIDWESTDEDGL